MIRRTWIFLAPPPAGNPAPVAKGTPRILATLLSTLLASACANGPFADNGPAPGSSPSGTIASIKIGILLPLSGSNAALGQAMLKSAQLALTGPGAPALDPQDTGDAPYGGALAAQAAIAAGDGLLIGPLTSANTAQAAPVAKAANIPMLAFTTDVGQAQPGVWVLGVTPEQQVRRLVFAAKAEGRSKIAALLPDNALGNAMAAGLVAACMQAGLPPPVVAMHAQTMGSINISMRSLSDFADRRGAIEQKVKDAKASPDAAIRAQADSIAQTPIPPAPFDALLLGDTGTGLQEVITVLRYYDISPTEVRVMGPLLWGAFAGKLAALGGAWFSGPDPQIRAGFARQYQAKFGQMPTPLADIPYDAAALAQGLASSGGYSVEALTRPDGFDGVDGLFTLQQDGHLRRGLAVFQIQPGGGAAIIQPAPASLESGTS